MQRRRSWIFEMIKAFYENLKREIMSSFEKTGNHSFEHTQRVYDLAVRLGKIENADMDIVKTSALLHDIARLKQDRGECACHAEEGAKIARDLLMKTNFPKEKIDEVCYSIKSHRYNTGIKPNTKEAGILQDADRLDALGAIAVARIFDDGGKKKRPMYNPDLKIKEYNHNSESESSINHFYEKTLKIKPETFRTKKAQEIAKNKYKFVKDFVNRFIKEWNGEF